MGIYHLSDQRVKNDQENDTSVLWIQDPLVQNMKNTEIYGYHLSREPTKRNYTIICSNCSKEQLDFCLNIKQRCLSCQGIIESKNEEVNDLQLVPRKKTNCCNKNTAQIKNPTSSFDPFVLSCLVLAVNKNNLTSSRDLCRDNEINYELIMKTIIIPFFARKSRVVAKDIYFYIDKIEFKVIAVLPEREGIIGKSTKIRCTDYFCYEQLTFAYFIPNNPCNSDMNKLKNDLFSYSQKKLFISKSYNMSFNNMKFFVKNCEPAHGFISQETLITFEQETAQKIEEIELAVQDNQSNLVLSGLSSSQYENYLLEEYCYPYFLSGVTKYIEKGKQILIEDITFIVYNSKPESGFINNKSKIKLVTDKDMKHLNNQEVIPFIQNEEDTNCNQKKKFCYIPTEITDVLYQKPNNFFSSLSNELNKLFNRNAFHDYTGTDLITIFLNAYYTTKSPGFKEIYEANLPLFFTSIGDKIKYLNRNNETFLHVFAKHTCTQSFILNVFFKLSKLNLINDLIQIKSTEQLTFYDYFIYLLLKAKKKKLKPEFNLQLIQFFNVFIEKYQNEFNSISYCNQIEIKSFLYDIDKVDLKTEYSTLEQLFEKDPLFLHNIIYMKEIGYNYLNLLIQNNQYSKATKLISLFQKQNEIFVEMLFNHFISLLSMNLLSQIEIEYITYMKMLSEILPKSMFQRKLVFNHSLISMLLKNKSSSYNMREEIFIVIKGKINEPKQIAKMLFECIPIINFWFMDEHPPKELFTVLMKEINQNSDICTMKEKISYYKLTEKVIFLGIKNFEELITGNSVPNWHLPIILNNHNLFSKEVDHLLTLPQESLVIILKRIIYSFNCVSPLFFTRNILSLLQFVSKCNSYLIDVKKLESAIDNISQTHIDDFDFMDYQTRHPLLESLITLIMSFFLFFTHSLLPIDLISDALRLIINDILNPGSVLTFIFELDHHIIYQLAANNIDAIMRKMKVSKNVAYFSFFKKEITNHLSDKLTKTHNQFKDLQFLKRNNELEKKRRMCVCMYMSVLNYFSGNCQLYLFKKIIKKLNYKIIPKWERIVLSSHFLSEKEYKILYVDILNKISNDYLLISDIIKANYENKNASHNCKFDENIHTLIEQKKAIQNGLLLKLLKKALSSFPMPYYSNFKSIVLFASKTYEEEKAIEYISNAIIYHINSLTPILKKEERTMNDSLMLLKNGIFRNNFQISKKKSPEGSKIRHIYHARWKWHEFVFYDIMLTVNDYFILYHLDPVTDYRINAFLVLIQEKMNPNNNQDLYSYNSSVVWMIVFDYHKQLIELLQSNKCQIWINPFCFLYVLDLSDKKELDKAIKFFGVFKQEQIQQLFQFTSKHKNKFSFDIDPAILLNNISLLSKSIQQFRQIISSSWFQNALFNLIIYTFAIPYSIKLVYRFDTLVETNTVSRISPNPFGLAVKKQLIKSYIEEVFVPSMNNFENIIFLINQTNDCKLEIEMMNKLLVLPEMNTVELLNNEDQMMVLLEFLSYFQNTNKIDHFITLIINLLHQDFGIIKIIVEKNEFSLNSLFSKVKTDLFIKQMLTKSPILKFFQQLLWLATNNTYSDYKELIVYKSETLPLNLSIEYIKSAIEYYCDTLKPLIHREDKTTKETFLLLRNGIYSNMYFEKKIKDKFNVLTFPINFISDKEDTNKNYKCIFNGLMKSLTNYYTVYHLDPVTDYRINAFLVFIQEKMNPNNNQDLYSYNSSVVWMIVFDYHKQLIELLQSNKCQIWINPFCFLYVLDLSDKKELDKAVKFFGVFKQEQIQQLFQFTSKHKNKFSFDIDPAILLNNISLLSKSIQQFRQIISSSWFQNALFNLIIYTFAIPYGKIQAHWYDTPVESNIVSRISPNPFGLAVKKQLIKSYIEEVFVPSMNNFENIIFLINQTNDCKLEIEMMNKLLVLPEMNTVELLNNEDQRNCFIRIFIYLLSSNYFDGLKVFIKGIMGQNILLKKLIEFKSLRYILAFYFIFVNDFPNFSQLIKLSNEDNPKEDFYLKSLSLIFNNNDFNLLESSTISQKSSSEVEQSKNHQDRNIATFKQKNEFTLYSEVKTAISRGTSPFANFLLNSKLVRNNFLISIKCSAEKISDLMNIVPNDLNDESRLELFLILINLKNKEYYSKYKNFIKDISLTERFYETLCRSYEQNNQFKDHLQLLSSIFPFLNKLMLFYASVYTLTNKVSLILFNEMNDTTKEQVLQSPIIYYQRKESFLIDVLIGYNNIKLYFEFYQIINEGSNTHLQDLYNNALKQSISKLEINEDSYYTINVKPFYPLFSLLKKKDYGFFISLLEYYSLNVVIEQLYLSNRFLLQYFTFLKDEKFSTKMKEFNNNFYQSSMLALKVFEIIGLYKTKCFFLFFDQDLNKINQDVFSPYEIKKKIKKDHHNESNYIRIDYYLSIIVKIFYIFPTADIFVSMILFPKKLSESNLLYILSEMEILGIPLIEVNNNLPPHFFKNKFINDINIQTAFDQSSFQQEKLKKYKNTHYVPLQNSIQQALDKYLGNLIHAGYFILAELFLKHFKYEEAYKKKQTTINQLAFFLSTSDISDHFNNLEKSNESLAKYSDSESINSLDENKNIKQSILFSILRPFTDINRIIDHIWPNERTVILDNAQSVFPAFQYDLINLKSSLLYADKILNKDSFERLYFEKNDHTTHFKDILENINLQALIKKINNYYLQFLDNSIIEMYNHYYDDYVSTESFMKEIKQYQSLVPSYVAFFSTMKLYFKLLIDYISELYSLKGSFNALKHEKDKQSTQYFIFVSQKKDLEKLNSNNLSNIKRWLSKHIHNQITHNLHLNQLEYRIPYYFCKERKLYVDSNTHQPISEYLSNLNLLFFKLIQLKFFFLTEIDFKVLKLQNQKKFCSFYFKKYIMFEQEDDDSLLYFLSKNDQFNFDCLSLRQKNNSLSIGNYFIKLMPNKLSIIVSFLERYLNAQNIQKNISNNKHIQEDLNSFITNNLLSFFSDEYLYKHMNKLLLFKTNSLMPIQLSDFANKQYQFEMSKFGYTIALTEQFSQFTLSLIPGSELDFNFVSLSKIINSFADKASINIPKNSSIVALKPKEMLLFHLNELIFLKQNTLISTLFEIINQAYLNNDKLKQIIINFTAETGKSKKIQLTDQITEEIISINRINTKINKENSLLIDVYIDQIEFQLNITNANLLYDKKSKIAQIHVDFDAIKQASSKLICEALNNINNEN